MPRKKRSASYAGRFSFAIPELSRRFSRGNSLKIGTVRLSKASTYATLRAGELMGRQRHPKHVVPTSFVYPNKPPLPGRSLMINQSCQRLISLIALVLTLSGSSPRNRVGPRRVRPAPTCRRPAFAPQPRTTTTARTDPNAPRSQFSLSDPSPSGCVWRHVERLCCCCNRNSLRQRQKSQGHCRKLP